MQPKWTRRLGLVGLSAAIMWAFDGLRAGARRRSIASSPTRWTRASSSDADLSDQKDDPEFYMRNTVVDVPYGAAQDGLFTASYAQPPSRIKWEVTEDALIARQTARAHPGHRPLRHHVHGQGPGRGHVRDPEPLRHPPLLQPADGRRAKHHRGELDRPSLVPAPVHARRLVQEHGDRRLRSRHPLADRPLRRHQVGPHVLLGPRPERSERAGRSTSTTATSTSRRRPSRRRRSSTRPIGSFPACFFPGEWGGSNPYGNCNPTEVTLRLSFKKRGRHRLRADGPGRQPDAGLRFLHRRTATATTVTTASSTRSGTASRPSTTSGRRATSKAASAPSTTGATRTATSPSTRPTATAAS